MGGVDRVLYLLCDLELWPWPCIFLVKFEKCCISGMGGHGTKGMWVNRVLDSWPHPWPWPWIFKVFFFKQLHLRNGGYGSIGCYTKYVTLSFDFDRGYSIMNTIKGGMAGIWVDRLLYQICDIELWLRPWILKVKFWKSSIIVIRGWIEKGCDSIGCWTQVMTLNFDLTHDLDLGFSRSNFNSHIFGMEGRLTWNERDVSWIQYWTHNGLALGP